MSSPTQSCMVYTDAPPEGVSEAVQKALEGLEDRPPELPDGLAQAKIDPDTGLLAAPGNPAAVTEIFQAGRLPEMQEWTTGDNQDAPPEEDPYQIY